MDKNTKLKTAVKWLVDQMLENCDGEMIPFHFCEFETNPEAGKCDFHERWFDAFLLVYDENGNERGTG